MKRKYSLVLLAGILTAALLSVNTSFCFAQKQSPGIHFFEGTFQEAMAKAKAEKKLVFFDAYASWCGPCKHMDEDIFILSNVGGFFNKNYICIRVDMEKGEGPGLAKTLRSIDGYPSLLFLSGDGHVIKTILGSRSADALVAEAKLAMIN